MTKIITPVTETISDTITTFKMLNFWNLATLVFTVVILGGATAEDIVTTEDNNLNESSNYMYNLFGFAWTNCDGAELPVQLNTLKVSPDPIVIPGTVMISGSAVSSADVLAPVKVSLTVKRKIAFFWVTIPCIMGVGSCTYDDICAVLDKEFPIKTPCPPILKKNGIPCHCPFLQGKYRIPLSPVEIESGPSIPSWLSNGQYSIQFTVEDQDQEIACEQITFSLKSSSITEDLENNEVATKIHDVL